MKRKERRLLAPEKVEIIHVSGGLLRPPRRQNRLTAQGAFSQRSCKVAYLIGARGWKRESLLEGLAWNKHLGEVRDPKVNKPSSVNLKRLNNGSQNTLFAVPKVFVKFILLLAVIANHYTECSIYPIPS